MRELLCTTLYLNALPNQRNSLVSVCRGLPILLIGIHVFGPLAAAKPLRTLEKERERRRRASNETNCSLI